MTATNPIVLIFRSKKQSVIAAATNLFSNLFVFSSFSFFIKKNKRSRGRPKKSFLFHSIQKIKNYIKTQRGKGRPKKVATYIKEISPIEKLLPKRGRGRPKKLSVFDFGPFKLLISIVRPPLFILRYFPIQTISIITIGFFVFFGMYTLSEYIFKDLPTVSELNSREQRVTTKILDRKGKTLYKVYEDENRSIISLSDVPKTMIDATIAIEDKDFYNHHGFSIRGIFRATVANLEGKQIQGGSTLTQQLVKNTLLSSEKTFTRKARELLLAIFVESNFTKDQILEMYFNQIAYGGSTYGVEEAAQRYFGKSATKLTLAESAMLAGLPAAPSAYTPFGPNPEYAYTRQAEVLRRMLEDGYITAEQADKAKNEVLQFKNDSIDIEAAHFVMYVRNLLAEEYGEEMVSNGGLLVTTTLDSALQKEAQKLVTDEVNALNNLRVSNGASLITNPKTGEILSMVGSKDYFDFAHDGQVNVTIRERQPGSSIKPLTYAMALEKGKTPLTRIEDSPITYNIEGSPPYTPKNYDGNFHGNVTLKEALGSSYNIPAVKLLAEIGVSNLIDKGTKMGITTWAKNKNRFGLSLTLGGGEITMIDMTQVYGAFANGGYSIKPNPILEVRNYKGDILYRNECALDNKNCTNEKVLDQGVAYLITSMLSDNTARIPAFGPFSTLFIPNHQVAVKTGTTNNLRDNWTFGYTSDRLVAVWVGNNDNTSMSYIASGVTGASTIWNRMMRLLLDDTNPHTFAIPSNVVGVNTCPNGTINCGSCANSKIEYFIRTTEPPQNCQVISGKLRTPTPSPRVILRRNTNTRNR